MLRLLLTLSSIYLVSGFNRVCYYDSWARYRAAPNTLAAADIDPHVCTHLIFAFAELNNDTYELEHSAPGDESEYRHFTALKKQNPSLYTMLAVGGWEMGTYAFSGLVETPARLTNFAQTTLTFLRKYGFDGIDIDWEYPGIEYRGGSAGEKQRFVELLRIMRDTFDNEELQGDQRRLLISAAVATHDQYMRKSFDVAKISLYLDFINMMEYDFHGDWDDIANVHSALYSADDLNVDHHVHAWIAAGAPPSKLMLGVPLYGRTFTLVAENSTEVGTPITEGGFMPYFRICELIQNRHLHVNMLDTERVPYFVHGDQWVGYDNQQSVEEKARYAVKMQMGGIMVWALALDDSSGSCGQGNYPLMTSIKAGLTTEVGPIGK